jgi:hypothetical protein
MSKITFFNWYIRSTFLKGFCTSLNFAESISVCSSSFDVADYIFFFTLNVLSVGVPNLKLQDIDQNGYEVSIPFVPG